MEKIMSESQWVEKIKDLLYSRHLGSEIEVRTKARLPYAGEFMEYDIDLQPSKANQSTTAFETDLLVCERTGDIIKPRVVIEAKFGGVTTHDAIIYSYKAQRHKAVTPYLRYGIMLGNMKEEALPWRLFRHGAYFDFMIRFSDAVLTMNEKDTFVDLIKSEMAYSRQWENMILDSRKKSRTYFFCMQNKPHFKEMKKNRPLAASGRRNTSLPE